MRKFFDLSSPRQAYSFGLALIAVLVTVQFFGMRVATEQQQVSAVEINLSGRQRMLSQRIAWTLYRIGNEAETATAAEGTRLRALLAVCVDLMERSHRALVTRNLGLMQAALDAGGACLEPGDTGARAVPPDRLPIADPEALASFTQRAWEVAVGRVAADDIRELAIFSDAPVSALLSDLNADTLAAQQASTRQLSALLNLNWLLILGLVVGEILLIFRPMANAVEQTVARLREANHRLRESETRLQDFANTGAHHFWETDAVHRVTWMDTADPELSPQALPMRLGQRPWEMPDLADDPDAGDWQAHEALLDRHEAFSGFEYAVSGQDGGKVWWRVNGRPVFSEAGVFQGYRGTSLDITSEREAELRLRLSERMQAVGQLTAGVAHDFNNLLAVVQCNADLVLLEDSSTARKKSVLEINAAVARGASLTARLLAFGRVQRLRAEPVALRSFLENLEALLERTLGPSLELHVALPTEPLYVLADRHQLEDACLNLALNARDASAPGGKFFIEARVAREYDFAKRSDATPAPEGFICLQFRDEGRGMDAEVRQRVFEPFFTTKQVGEGSGLGLSMVYGFAAQSKGFVAIDSKPGQGTRVELCLPRVSQAQPVRRGAVAPVPANLQGKSILIVEDNDALRFAARRHLEALGLYVTDAADGSAALACLQTDRFDLLLTDVLLPGPLDGFDVARQGREADPSLAVVMCSGQVDLPSQAARRDVATGEILRKPFTARELAAALHAALTEVRAQ